MRHRTYYFFNCSARIIRALCRPIGLCLLVNKIAMPKICPSIWAFIAHGLGTQCPRLGHSMPTAWSFDAHGLVTRCPRVGPWRTTVCSQDNPRLSHNFLLLPSQFLYLKIMEQNVLTYEANEGINAGLLTDFLINTESEWYFYDTFMILLRHFFEKYHYT